MIPGLNFRRPLQLAQDPILLAVASDRPRRQLSASNDA